MLIFLLFSDQISGGEVSGRRGEKLLEGVHPRAREPDLMCGILALMIVMVCEYPK